MARYQLHRWFIKWQPATKNHGPLAEVHIHGKHNGFFVKNRVVEYFKIPIDPQAPRDRKAQKQLVKEAMKRSTDSWSTPLFW